MVLQHPEGLENGGRVTLVEFHVHDLEQFIARLKALVECNGLRGLRREDAHPQVLQNDLVELGDRARRAVVRLHQLLAGPLGVRVAQP